MNDNTQYTGSDNGNRIFEIVGVPSKERIQFLRAGFEITIGDFGWSSPRAPKDKEGLIHLTGYDEKYLNIWYADFTASEVRYVGEKTIPAPIPNPFPVKRLD